MKDLPDQMWLASCLRFDNDAYANLCDVRVTNESKSSKITGIKSFDKMFLFIWTVKLNAGVFDWPFKLFNKRSKVNDSLLLLHIFLAFNAPYHHLNQFLCRNPARIVAWWEHFTCLCQSYMYNEVHVYDMYICSFMDQETSLHTYHECWLVPQQELHATYFKLFLV